jgi:hypothetical protein
MKAITKSVLFAALLSSGAVGCSAPANQAGGDGRLSVSDPSLQVRSLTGPDYTGKKYYFGWGMNDNGNPEMDNEVAYDVRHTHDIFTKNVGGDYIGATLIGQDQVDGTAIKNEWSSLTHGMKTDDMYLQYSSGHGYPGGLEAGVDYNDIINGVLAMPAKEIVIFTMACYSGGLVDAFNQAQSRWSDFKSKGRTLFVMASSTADEESSTGPGTDPDEPNGPDGSAGSAFGHSLWKALIGYADKSENGGNNDGFITLGEITKYVVSDTETEGGHTPVFTGVYDDGLKVAQRPTKAQARDLLGDVARGARRLQKLIDDGVIADE